MKKYYVESIISEIALEINSLISRKIITLDKKIVLCGLDTFSFSMRTILGNAGFNIDSYISDDQGLLLYRRRLVKAARARYLNSSRDLIGMYSIDERLIPYDEDAIIINASRNSPIGKMEELNYKKDVQFFQVFDWEQDSFTDAMRIKRHMDLREIQNVAKGILQKVDRFCMERDIRYWVCGGTLLGTIRHKGFIPWDDDVDIFMPWQDYLRFLKEYRGDEYHGLLSPDGVDRKDYFELFAKVIDSRTIVREDYDFIRKVHPVAIDVFPLIGLPEEESERLLFFKQYYELESTIWEDFYANNGNLEVFNKWYLTQKQFLEQCDFDRSDYVGVLATAYRERDCTTRQVYETTFRMPFEDIEINVPSGYKEYLDNLYGFDWMQLPDEDKRVSHHNMEAYWQ